MNTAKQETSERLRVLVCDDDGMIREALSEVLCEEPDFDVVGVAADTDEAIALAALHRPAVAVVDVRMPGGGGARVAREIMRRSPGTRILTFSAYADLGAIDEMRDLGVTEYLLKGVPNTEIVAAVRRLGRSGVAR
ncbi:response regulator [Streptomyces sp. NBC_01803]|uniref:response regulator n=1 Tax=Streptomyces sp. NBC_01803 TaxID=2975946 RepID=UPI002DD7BE98|nr:response regulator transcription factor [Streptomyces sp. NBC_01803]WSA43596.1 response regulator transcription factor [Streptomyces sp. NBC_01803]